MTSRGELYIYACLGSMAVYLWGEGGSNFLDERFPKWTPGPLKDVVAFLLYVMLGALFGVLATDPSTARQALFSGLGWPVLLGFIRRKRP